MCLSTLNHRALRAKFHTNGGSQNQILMLHDPACKNFADMNFSLRAQFSAEIASYYLAPTATRPISRLFIPFGAAAAAVIFLLFVVDGIDRTSFSW